MPARTSRGYRIQPASRGKHTEPWRMRSYSPASPIRPKVPVVRRRRKEHLIAVRLLKKPPGAADNFRGFAEKRRASVYATSATLVLQMPVHQITKIGTLARILDFSIRGGRTRKQPLDTY